MGQFWDGFGLVLEWFSSGFGTVWESFRVILRWFWNGFGAVLGRFWDGLGMLLAEKKKGEKKTPCFGSVVRPGAGGRYYMIRKEYTTADRKPSGQRQKPQQ